MANLKLRNVAKSYDSTQVIESIDLDIDDGQFVVFVGPSGCGKSTLLRMIAGLEVISSGTIEIGGSIVNDVAPAKRGVAMVFQTYALYPHMTVFNNMAFGLKQVRTPKDEIKKRVQAAAEILDITKLLERTPRALSEANGSVLQLDERLFESQKFSYLMNHFQILMQHCVPKHELKS